MIVYIGNMLSRHGSSINFMELMVPKLKEVYEVKAASSQRNKLLRLMDMMRCVWLNRRQCRIVIIDTYSTTAFWYAYLVSLACRLFSIPYLPVLHGGNLPDRFLKDARVMKSFLRNASKIISPSRYLEEFFKARGYLVLYIPNFIDITFYRFVARQRLRPRILWVRAFQRIYDPLLAIKVFKIVATRYPEAQLCMVGAAKDSTFEEAMGLSKELGVSEKVEFTGILPKKEWVRRAQEFDVFINTTTIDNMPISVIEAMALGLPVVSTNVGGIPYLIDHERSGLLTSPGVPDEMASAIIQLLEDSKLALYLAKNARAKVESFSWDRVKTQWYEELNEYCR